MTYPWKWKCVMIRLPLLTILFSLLLIHCECVSSCSCEPQMIHGSLWEGVFSITSCILMFQCVLAESKGVFVDQKTTQKQQNKLATHKLLNQQHNNNKKRTLKDKIHQKEEGRCRKGTGCFFSHLWVHKTTKSHGIKKVISYVCVNTLQLVCVCVCVNGRAEVNLIGGELPDDGTITGWV